VELILVRHGLPERVRVDGGRADPPLTPTGWEQAQRVARLLHAEHDGGQPFHAVYASTMRRAFETAQPFAALANLPVNLEEGVVEYDRNHQEYIPMEELKRTDYARWKAMAESGFGEGADMQQFHVNVVTALEAIIDRHRGQRVVVFCHGGVINTWTTHVLGMQPRMFFEPVYTSVHRFLCASSGQRNLVTLNERHHLAGT
jgi:probable phosphoglycerate mutase